MFGSAKSQIEFLAEMIFPFSKPLTSLISFRLVRPSKGSSSERTRLQKGNKSLPLISTDCKFGAELMIKPMAVAIWSLWSCENSTLEGLSPRVIGSLLKNEWSDDEFWDPSAFSWPKRLVTGSGTAFLFLSLTIISRSISTVPLSLIVQLGRDLFWMAKQAGACCRKSEWGIPKKMRRK